MVTPTSSFKTPGVYIQELDAFPNGVVGVPTAVPVFVGYTETVNFAGKSVAFEPTSITSLADYVSYFGAGYKPVCQLQPATAADAEITSSFGAYRLQPPSPNFNLYRCLQLFYANGGGSAYVVSVGDYTSSAISAADLQKGLTALSDFFGPTLLVVPEAAQLESPGSFANVAQAMLQQASSRQDRFAVLDVWGAQTIDPAHLDKQLTPVITAFQALLGDIGLDYGAAYFPPLNTTVIGSSEIDYTWFDPSQPAPASANQAAGTSLLQAILREQAITTLPPGNALTELLSSIDEISTVRPDGTPATQAKITALNNALTTALPPYKALRQTLCDKANVLPVSAAIAGVYARNDQDRGVWNAPANLGLAQTLSPTLVLNDDQQGPLNTPVNGRAVNVIREFPGQGATVWGARTLDGNSSDWRYIQARRTGIYVETSIKLALQPFVFAPNTASTWTSITAMISSFLTGLWQQGGLMGDKASDAFSVQCGVGTTMTAQDILDGYLVVVVRLQMIYPAEFIELTFNQKMQSS